MSENKQYPIVHLVWKRTSHSEDRKYQYTTNVSVYENKNSCSVMIDSYSTGPRGGYSFTGFAGFTSSEWVEISSRVEAKIKLLKLDVREEVISA